MKTDALKQIPLFASLPPGEIAHLARDLRSCEMAQGDIILAEGSSDEHFYVLLEGTVEIIKAAGTADERSLGVRMAACLLGEMSLFSRDGRHTATVRAQSRVRLLQITRSDLDALLQRRPALAYDLIRLLSNRLEESENSTILDLREKNRQLTQAYLELQAAQAQLVEKERLERELEIARNMQLSVLPPALPQQPGIELGALIHPARAVGGDFYDVFPLGEQRLGIVVGDVCDKGVPAALFMMRTYSLLRARIGRRSAPAQVLHAVNRHLIRRNPGGMFVTLLYGILDAASGRFSYARAGHPSPFMLDARQQAAGVAQAGGQPLGLWPTPRLDVQDLTIPAGGLLLLFSDGLSDALAQEGVHTTLQGICAAATSEPQANAQSICERIWQDAVAGSGAGQPDDFVVVAVRRTATGARSNGHAG